LAPEILSATLTLGNPDLLRVTFDRPMDTSTGWLGGLIPATNFQSVMFASLSREEVCSSDGVWETPTRIRCNMLQIGNGVPTDPVIGYSGFSDLRALEGPLVPGFGRVPCTVI